MPVLLHMGPAAPCGLTRYESDAFGKAYQDNLFACYFNLHKVSRHVLTPQGATFTTKDEDFVTSPDLDFHPTDVLEDADGSLLVVDTGGWYKLCCPTSQLQKPDVLGAIYRVQASRDAPRVDDPRGTTADRAKSQTRNRSRAQSSSSCSTTRARPCSTWRSNLSPHPERKETAASLRCAQARRARCVARHSRRNAVWTLARIDDPARTRSLVRDFLTDPDETVRQAAIHSAGLWRDRGAVAELDRAARRPFDAQPPRRRRGPGADRRQVRRARTPGGRRRAGRSRARTLAHLCLDRDRRSRRQPRPACRARTPESLRAALVALDQMDGGGLDPKFVAGLLASADAGLKETASWIVGRHPEWAGALAGVLGERLDRPDLPPAERAELERQLGRFAQAAPIQQLLAARLRDASAPRAARRSSLQAMAWSGLKEKQVPREWIEALAGVLDGRSAECRAGSARRRDRARLAARPGHGRRACRPPAPDRRRRQESRRAPARAPSPPCPAAWSKPDREPLRVPARQARGHRDSREPHDGGRRPGAGQAHARAARPAGRGTADRRAGRSRPPAGRLRAIDRRVARPEAGRAPSPTRRPLSSLRVDALKAHLAKYGPAVQKEAEALYARLNVDAAKQKAQLEQLLPTLSAGDIRRGQLVFHSEKAACYSCHAIGYRGGNVGPDLTRIGSVRADRDLLEAIVFPSASFVRSFEPIAVATSDGKVYNGLLRGETADELLLATGVNQEARIARREIEEMRPSTVSVMPAGLDQQLTPQELADLVAFLKACK